MLTEEEERRTAQELQSNLAASGLDRDRAAADLAFTPERFRRSLEVDAADPVDVWQLRDYLERAVRESGGELTDFTVLTEDARRRARGWFCLREAPPPSR